MLCAVTSGHRRHAIVARLLLAVVAATVGIGFGAPVRPSSAVGDTITATVRDSLPPSLTVDAPPQAGIFSTPHITLTGLVHNITQIMVYIDSVLYSTVPINVNASTYVLAISLDPGSHQIKLVGIDSYTGAQIERLVQVQYIPTLPSGEPAQGSIGDQADQAITTAGQAALLLGQKAGDHIDQASSSGPMQRMTDGAYQLLRGVGLISVYDKAGPTGTMFGRFLLIATGIILLIVPWGVYLLAYRLRLIPYVAKMTFRLTIPLRLLGMALILLPFIFVV